MGSQGGLKRQGSNKSGKSGKSKRGALDLTDPDGSLFDYPDSQGGRLDDVDAMLKAADDDEEDEDEDEDEEGEPEEEEEEEEDDSPCVSVVRHYFSR
jgi:hypothetical protein